MRYAVVIEKVGKGFSGYATDLPGCVPAGATVAKVKAALAEVISFHLARLRAGSAPMALPQSAVEWVEV